MTVVDEARTAREALVREHMDSENRHDFDATLTTFTHPRYELIATGEVFDGEDEVRGYYARTRAAFPDQRNEVIALHHADDAVIVEFDLLGTHTGPLGAMAATGRAFRCRIVALFLFDGDPDQLRAGVLRLGIAAPPARAALTIRRISSP